MSESVNRTVTAHQDHPKGLFTAVAPIAASPIHKAGSMATAIPAVEVAARAVAVVVVAVVEGVTEMEFLKVLRSEKMVPQALVEAFRVLAASSTQWHSSFLPQSWQPWSSHLSCENV